MTKYEQIQEMARFIHNLCTDIPDSISQHCKLTCAECKARYAYSKGYRKASEVAREIFEEIEKKVKMSIAIHLEELNKELIIDTPLYDRHSGIIFALRGAEDYLAELKKKYTEGEK